MLHKILIVDDDERINEMLCDTFEMEGYHVVSAYNGEEALKVLEGDTRNEIDLVLLDVMMPVLSGWDILSYIKENFDVKVIMLTALDDEKSELKGLRSGADDYVSKPFNRDILLERVKKLLNSAKNEKSRGYKFGDLLVNRENYKIYLKNQLIPVTSKEFEILSLLMKNSNIVLPRDVILEKIWGIDYECESRTLDTHIKMLRHSLGEYGEHIRTVRGVGYSFEGKVDWI